MSTYFYGSHQQHLQNSHAIMQSNHHGRSRRNQRMSSTQPNSRQYKQQQHHHSHQQQQPQQQKLPEKVVMSEAPALTAFRARFEAGRSFDLDDDLEFCPNLLTWDERQSVASGSSDRSSLSSGSPDSSPLQHQIQPHMGSALTLPSAYASPPTNFSMNTSMKLHQPSAIRSRNPIPIVNPDTRNRMSPPSSISPSMMQQSANQRSRW